MRRILTGDGGGVLESSRNIRVHGDHEVLLLSDFRVSGLDLALNPVLKRVAQHAGSHVADPLLGRLRDLDLVGKVLVDSRILLEDLLVHVFDGETLVVRDSDMPDLLGFDVYETAE